MDMQSEICSAQNLTSEVLNSFALKAFIPSAYFTLLYDIKAQSIVHCSTESLNLTGFSCEAFTYHLWERLIEPEFLVTWKRNMKLTGLFFNKLARHEIPNYIARFSYQIYDRCGTIKTLQQTSLPIVSAGVEHVKEMVVIVRQDKTEKPPKGVLDLIGFNGSPTYLAYNFDSSLPEVKIGLTKREMEVFQLLKKNYTSEQIARRLFLSKHTVRIHRRNLLKKLGACNTRELIFKTA